MRAVFAVEAEAGTAAFASVDHRGASLRVHPALGRLHAVGAAGSLRRLAAARAGGAAAMPPHELRGVAVRIVHQSMASVFCAARVVARGQGITAAHDGHADPEERIALAVIRRHRAAATLCRGLAPALAVVLVALAACTQPYAEQSVPPYVLPPRVLSDAHQDQDLDAPPADGVDASDASRAAAAAAPTSASCAGLPRNCGPQGNESCCDAPTVPGGTFLREYDGAGYTSTMYPATVHPFQLDRFEVTVGRFRAFVNAYPGSKPAAGAGRNMANSQDRGWDALSWNGNLAPDQGALSSALHCGNDSWTPEAGANEPKPINCVTWFEAFAFCAWDGGRLPTDAEWSFAASGGDQQRVYPWSSPPLSSSIDATYADYDCTGDGSQPGSCSITDILFVGSRSPRGDGRWSHADLGGGMWELVVDWNGAYPMPCNDCANLTPGTQRSIRGGSFQDGASVLRTAVRSVSLSQDTRTPNIGFRCAR